MDEPSRSKGGNQYAVAEGGHSVCRSEHLAAQRRRRDPRHGREVRRQSGHRHRLDDRAHRHQPGPLRLWPATLALLRLRRRQRAVRLRLEPFASLHHAQNRQGPAQVSGCRGIGRFHPLRRRRPGAGAGRKTSGEWQREQHPPTTVDGARMYYAFSAIARASKGCSPASSAGPIVQIRETSTGARSRKDNITTWYGKTAESRIADPADPPRVFSWLICESYDDKGNAIVYEIQGGELGRRRHLAERTSATAPTDAAARPTAISSASSTAIAADRALLDQRRPTSAQSETGCSRSSSTTASTDARRSPHAGLTPGDMAVPPRSVLLLPRRLRSAHLSPLPARA